MSDAYSLKGNLEKPISEGKAQRMISEMAAPAGFGLGAAAAVIDANKEFTKVTGTGFYSWNRANTAPDKPFTAGELLVIKRNDAIIDQIAFSQDSLIHQVQMRKVNNGAGTPWEWVNPPMAVGVEYRTIERYAGKPVYCRLVNCGDVTAGTPHAVTYSDDTNCRPIHVGGGVSSGVAIQTGLASVVTDGVVTSQSHKMEFGGYLNYITMLPSVTVSGVLVIVKYYKTTD